MSLSYFILNEPDWYPDLEADLKAAADATIDEVRVQADLNEAQIITDTATAKAAIETIGDNIRTTAASDAATENATMAGLLATHKTNADAAGSVQLAIGFLIAALSDAVKSINTAAALIVGKSSEGIADSIALSLESNGNTASLVNNTVADLESLSAGLATFYGLFGATSEADQVDNSQKPSTGGKTGTIPGVSGGQKYLSLILEAQTSEDQNFDSFVYGHDYIYDKSVAPLILQNVIPLETYTLIMQTAPLILKDPITKVDYIKVPPVLLDNPFQLQVDEFNQLVDLDSDLYVYGLDYMKHDTVAPEGLLGIKRPNNQMIMLKNIENDTNPGSPSTLVTTQFTLTFLTNTRDGNQYSIEIYKARIPSDILNVQLFDTRIIVQLDGGGGGTPNPNFPTGVHALVAAINAVPAISALLTAVDDVTTYIANPVPPFIPPTIPVPVTAVTMERTYLAGGETANREIVTGNSLDPIAVILSKEARWRIDFDTDEIRYGVDYIYKNDLIPSNHQLKEIYVKNDIELQQLDLEGGNCNPVGVQPSVTAAFATKYGLTPSGGNFVIELVPRNGTALSDALKVDEPIVINTPPPLSLLLDIDVYKLLLENKTGVDQNGDGLVYGTDWRYSDTPPVEFTDVVYDPALNPAIYYDNVTPMTPLIYADLRAAFDQLPVVEGQLIYGTHYIYTPAYVPAHLEGIPALDPVKTLIYDQAPELDGQPDMYLITLMREHLSKVDLDDDGLVYGTDWIFKPGVAPQALNYITASSPSTVIINTLTFPTATEYKLLQEAYGKGDVNGDRLVYAKDYVYRVGTIPALFADIVPEPGALTYGYNGSHLLDYRYFTLLKEYATGQDLNGDGKVYGVDYVFAIGVRPIEINHITTGAITVPTAPNINGTYIT